MGSYIVARHHHSLRTLSFLANEDDEFEEADFGGGWRMLELPYPVNVREIAIATSAETDAPALCAYGSESGFLILRLSEKRKHVTTLLVNGVAEARAAGVIDDKYKVRRLAALGLCSSWAKKAKLKENHDALRLATTRDAVPGVHGEELLRTYFVGLGIPNCETVDPYWNEVGDMVTAERKAKWMPSYEVDVRIDL